MRQDIEFYPAVNVRGNKMDIIALGELLIDFASIAVDDEGYPTLAAHPGGGPANFLAGALKYGMKAGMICKVGNDAFGKMLTGTMKKIGASVEGIVVDNNVFTTLAFVTLDKNGDRSFSFSRKPGADTCLTSEEVRYDLIDESDVFHFGTLSLTTEPAKEATYKAIEYARKNGKLISFDPNLRELLWDDLEEAKRQIIIGLKASDIVKISDNEVEFLWGLDPEAGLKKILDEFPAKLVYVTCGANGCIASNRNFCVKTESLKGVKAVDTTGAGDIFGGSAMARFLAKKKKIEELTEEDLKDITRFACTAAGLSTENYGGISSVPEIEDVEERMKEEYLK